MLRENSHSTKHIYYLSLKGFSHFICIYIYIFLTYIYNNVRIHSQRIHESQSSIGAIRCVHVLGKKRRKETEGIEIFKKAVCLAELTSYDETLLVTVYSFGE